MILLVALLVYSNAAMAQGTRLLRQPSITETHVSFAYGGDIWITDLEGGKTVRITSTPGGRKQSSLFA